MLHNTVELDQSGVCWDADLVRTADGAAWQARSLRGSAWTTLRRAEKISNRINAYRVLLTRARFATIIWIPRGAARDPTRSPALYDGIAAYLAECGATWLDGTAIRVEDVTMPDPILL